MNYYLDTEFIEGFKKPIKWLPTVGKFNKPYHSIQLISIGIVCEDGREYYAISNEFNAKDANAWVLENVIQNIELDWIKSYSGDCRNQVLQRITGKGTYSAIKIMQEDIGKSNKQIAEEIKDFVFKCKLTSVSTDEKLKEQGVVITENPDFYAYYADYDWVVFCSLFGTMMDLPKGFPMFCKDLKQTLDEKAMKLTSLEATEIAYPGCKHDVFEFLEKTTNGNYKINALKTHANYPKQENEHNALDDAKWNYKLHKFLKSI